LDIGIRPSLLLYPHYLILFQGSESSELFLNI
jgi:hypothetical protein